MCFERVNAFWFSTILPSDCSVKKRRQSNDDLLAQVRVSDCVCSSDISKRIRLISHIDSSTMRIYWNWARLANRAWTTLWQICGSWILVSSRWRQQKKRQPLSNKTHSKRKTNFEFIEATHLIVNISDIIQRAICFNHNSHGILHVHTHADSDRKTESQPFIGIETNAPNLCCIRPTGRKNIVKHFKWFGFFFSLSACAGIFLLCSGYTIRMHVARIYIFRLWSSDYSRNRFSDSFVPFRLRTRMGVGVCQPKSH